MSQTPPLTHYEVLGLDKKATSAQIKAAHRKLSREYHPDKNPGDRVKAAIFRQIQAAYDVLSKPEERAAYDRGQTPAAEPPPPASAPPPPPDLDVLRAQFIGQSTGGTLADLLLSTKLGAKAQQVAASCGVPDLRSTIQKGAGELAAFGAQRTKPKG